MPVLQLNCWCDDVANDAQGCELGRWCSSPSDSFGVKHQEDCFDLGVRGERRNSVQVSILIRLQQCPVRLHESNLSTDDGPPLRSGQHICSSDYRKALEMEGIECSMSRKGDCWDNAVAESFFSTLKREMDNLDHLESWEAAKISIAEYIDGFYNLHRRHSALNYNSPIEFELMHSLAVYTTRRLVMAILWRRVRARRWQARRGPP